MEKAERASNEEEEHPSTTRTGRYTAKNLRERTANSEIIVEATLLKHVNGEYSPISEMLDGIRKAKLVSGKTHLACLGLTQPLRQLLARLSVAGLPSVLIPLEIPIEPMHGKATDNRDRSWNAA
jgi:hypothetical protein